MSKKQRKFKNKIVKAQNLSKILATRTGGSIAIKGFNFQFLYACYVILNELSENSPEKSIRLEGIEDIDILHKNSYIQLKTSKNPIDASKFWSMGVLKNYLEVYVNDKNVNFIFIYDSIISKGVLKDLESKRINTKTLEFWSEKIGSLGYLNNFEIKEFLTKINFVKVNKEQLYNECKQLILKKFDLNNGAEEQYLFALLYQISIWSEERKTIRYQDLLKTIQFVKDSSSKTVSNNTIKHNYVNKINFETNDVLDDDMGYYDGKSAKPIHIAYNLPIEREYWQEIIKKSIEEFDLTIIKSSSGQGKSTLAWKVALFYKRLGFEIYELNYCNDNKKVEDIFDFFSTRVQIGQLPIIVIDGLDKRVKQWDKLIDRLNGLPIKIIVTTREEEWFRFGIDVSKIKLNIIDIALLESEAKDIFLQLQKREKLSKDIKNWQPIWEKIESKKLLIEYVYLLTHGDMLKNRLEKQIKYHANEDNIGAIKLEILRLVSIADTMTIKIQTKKLIDYIFSKINYTFDAGEILKSLSKEYYIQFDKKYIEGLHPVRSNHLVEILHEFFPIEKSLLSLLKIIDDDTIYEYFFYLPSFLDGHDEVFLQDITKIVSQKKYTFLVDALDGLMHYEPYYYWQKNRKIYDDVFEKGLINLFVNFNLPFSNLNTFEELSKVFNNELMKYIIKEKNKLSKFTFEDTLVSKICSYISNMLKMKDDFKGLAFIAKWLYKTNNKLPNIFEYSIEELITILEKKDIDEVKELFTYLYISNPKKYNELIKLYKDSILALLKIKTDSPTVYENDNEIYIEYIANNEKMDKLNECSVNRIDTFKEFFPRYVKYHTKAIYLPFPNEEIYKYAIQNSYKSIPSENLFDKFDIHLNVIWRKTIMKNYSFESLYEWQHYHKEVREIFLDFTKECNRLFEFIIENKKPRDIYPLYQKVFALLKKEKEFPVKSIRYSDKEAFQDELKAISEFKSSYRNFIDQFIGIIDKSNSHLPIINLNDSSQKLNNMQNAFKKIQNKTYQYFNLEELAEEENYWYARLLQTIEFYIYWEKNKERVTVAKDAVLFWHKKKEQDELNRVLILLKNLEEIGFDIYKPNKIIKKGNFQEVVVAIEELEEGDLEDILFALVDFIETDIDYINILRVVNKEISYGYRVPKGILIQVQSVLEGKEFKENEYENILPILDVDNELLKTLGKDIKVESKKPDEIKSNFIEIMFDVWKLMGYKKRLDINNKYEVIWLKEIEDKIKKSIYKKEKYLQKNEINIIKEVLATLTELNTSKLVEIMNKSIEVVEK